MIVQSHFNLPVRVYYEDTDAGGIVYNANYLKFFERARTEWFRELGVDQAVLLNQQIGFVIRHVEMDNIRAAKFNQLLTVTCTISELKKASLIFDQTIFIASSADASQQIICTGRFKVACVNLSKMKPVKIPAKIIEVLNSVT